MEFNLKAILTQFDTNKNGIIDKSELNALKKANIHIPLNGCKEGALISDIGDEVSFTKQAIQQTHLQAPQGETMFKKDDYFPYIELNGSPETPYTEHTAYSFAELPAKAPWAVTAYFYDISKGDFSREELLATCIHPQTTKMSAEQKEMIESDIEIAKDPGLNVRNIHTQTITKNGQEVPIKGSGVKIAIIDQPLGKHNEYDSNLIHHENINANAKEMASLHGSGVVSIAVGKTTGVAPNAELVYFSVDSKMGKDNTGYATAIRRVLDMNAQLEKEGRGDEKISVISISWGFNPDGPGYEELMAALEEAKSQNIFVVSSHQEHFADYNFQFSGANRTPGGNPNDADTYEAGAHIKERSETGEIYRDVEVNGQKICGANKDRFLFVPMSNRTVADNLTENGYRYDGNNGGMSWAIPWLSGMYVLAKQVDPSITPKEFCNLAIETSTECRNDDTNTYVGRMINPEELIKKLREKQEN